MSPSLRYLKAAVRKFASRSIEEEVDPEALREVLDELEGELDRLLESPEERAGLDEALARAIKSIRDTYGSHA
jgi:hypothetical protein